MRRNPPNRAPCTLILQFVLLTPVFFFLYALQFCQFVLIILPRCSSFHFFHRLASPTSASLLRQHSVLALNVFNLSSLQVSTTRQVSTFHVSVGTTIGLTALLPPLFSRPLPVSRCHCTPSSSQDEEPGARERGGQVPRRPPACRRGGARRASPGQGHLQLRARPGEALPLDLRRVC